MLLLFLFLLGLVEAADVASCQINVLFDLYGLSAIVL